MDPRALEVATFKVAQHAILSKQLQRRLQKHRPGVSAENSPIYIVAHVICSVFEKRSNPKLQDTKETRTHKASCFRCLITFSIEVVKSEFNV